MSQPRANDVHTRTCGLAAPDIGLQELTAVLRAEQGPEMAMRVYALLELVQATTPAELLELAASVSRRKGD
jgi:hypothetical protein